MFIGVRKYPTDQDNKSYAKARTSCSVMRCAGSDLTGVILANGLSARYEATFHATTQSLLFQRLLDQPIEHRRQITAILLQVLPHASRISAGVDQLDHVRQILALSVMAITVLPQP